jgi:hypothetical protein
MIPKSGNLFFKEKRFITVNVNGFQASIGMILSLYQEPIKN